MTTFEPCQQTLFDETECGPSMSSPAASHVRTYHMLASELALKVSDLVYGRSSPDLLARFDPGSQLWKTCQASLVLGMDEFSETWPRSGMTLSGTAYQLPPSAPLTGGTGSGSWPTPRANDAEKRGDIDPTNPRNGLLGRVVHQFPTPRAQSAHGSGPSRVGNKADLQTIVGGSLNPEWVEWLMGFPIGWTKVDGWKSRKASPASRRALKTAPRG